VGGGSPELGVAHAIGHQCQHGLALWVAGAWGIHLTNVQAAMGGMKSGRRRLPSHKLSQRRGAHPVIL
jgi:hypothetical protein